jgi:hypothetical protein
MGYGDKKPHWPKTRISSEAVSRACKIRNKVDDGLLWWGVCFGRLGREAGGTSSRKWGRGARLADVWNQVWWCSKLRIFSGSVPGHLQN